jgi:hypothetical protein
MIIVGVLVGPMAMTTIVSCGATEVGIATALYYSPRIDSSSSHPFSAPRYEKFMVDILLPLIDNTLWQRPLGG